jgi:hypothetical protein
MSWRFIGRHSRFSDCWVAAHASPHSESVAAVIAAPDIAGRRRAGLDLIRR